MKNSIIFSIFFVSLVNAKIYTPCELAQELFHAHQLTKDQTGSLVCIAGTRSLFDTSSHQAQEFFGLFKVGAKWWCGKDEKRGGCDIRCDDLIDDNITDDVKCARYILDIYGTDGWRLGYDSCKRYREISAECLEASTVPHVITDNNLESEVDLIGKY